jgi:HEAT repeat protein
MPIFGPPDIARLEAKQDLLGLIKALSFQKDPLVRCGAAEALGRSADPRAVPPLLAVIGDADSDVRRAAATSLGTLGDASAVEPLLVALGDPDHSVRAAAARALGRLRDPHAIEPLVGALKDGYAAVREAAAGALGAIGKPAVERLLEALKDSDGAVRKGAVEGLVQAGAPAIGPLVKALADPALRQTASATLGQIGDPSAVGPLLTALKHDNDQVRRAAADTLDLLVWKPDAGEGGAGYWAAKGQWQKCVDIGAPAVEPLIDALRHHDSLVRQVAARGLGQIGDIRAVEPLIAALRGREDVRAVAAQALGQIDDGRAVEPLIAALKDSGSNIRAASARALGQLGDLRAVDRLIAALKDHDSIVRSAAAVALGEIGDRRAVEPLIAAMKGREDVRIAAAVALGVIGDPRAVEPLIGALKDWRVCVPAAEALARIGAPAAAPLVAMLADRSELVQSTAVEALIVQIGLPAAAPLVVVLANEHDAVREAAANLLDRIGWAPDGTDAGAAYWAARGQWEKCVQIGVRAVEPLAVATVTWLRPDLRSAAAGALGIIGDARAVEPLTAAMKDGDQGVRAAAAQALGGIGDPRAVDVLIAALKDRGAEVRRAAAGALGRIDDPEAVAALEALLPKPQAVAPVPATAADPFRRRPTRRSRQPRRLPRQRPARAACHRAACHRVRPRHRVRPCQPAPAANHRVRPCRRVRPQLRHRGAGPLRRRSRLLVRPGLRLISSRRWAWPRGKRPIRPANRPGSWPAIWTWSSTRRPGRGREFTP